MAKRQIEVTDGGPLPNGNRQIYVGLRGEARRRIEAMAKAQGIPVEELLRDIIVDGAERARATRVKQ